MNEREIRVTSGWPMVVVIIGLFILAGFGVYEYIQVARKENWTLFGWLLAGDLLLWAITILMCFGFFVVEPNGSKVLLLFGKYAGTVKESGFHWTNPLMSKRPVSLRVRTLITDTLKVNDLTGNPVEIAVVVVWNVKDTFRAVFEVDQYESYVSTQSETAVRHLASSYPYDAEDETISLRRNTDEVSEHVREELQQRLERAGVVVPEARLSHLAYAPEIAGAMLRRQQASAIIAARQRIVDGAVGMVEMALEKLQAGNVVELDEERKASMVTNLMVILCSEHAAQPVVNAGTLYH